MNLAKVVLAMIIIAVGIIADWLSIVWGVKTGMQPMYIVLVVLVFTVASIILTIWDLKS